MERSLSQIKDVDQKILQELDDRELLDFCVSHKYGSELCKDENFWRKRIVKRYGGVNKNERRTWKNFYLTIVYYLDKYKDKNIALHEISKGGMKNLDIINFFLIRGASPNSGLTGAAAGGHVNLAEYFVSRGASDFINAYIFAVSNGHENIKNFIRDQGFQFIQLI